MKNILLRYDGLYTIVESFDSNYMNTCFLTFEIPSTGRIQYMIDDYHTSCIENRSIKDVADFFTRLSRYTDQQYVKVIYANDTLEFRISSILIDWSKPIYEFVSKFSSNYPAEFITIYRTVDIDSMDYTMYYKNFEDVAMYKVPIPKYLKTESSHTLLMNSTDSKYDIFHVLDEINCDDNKYHKLCYSESLQGVIYTDLYKTSSTRMRSKLSYVQRMILETHLDLFDVQIDSTSNSNNFGNDVGVSYIYLLRFWDGCDKLLKVDYTKSCISKDILYRDFCLKYSQEMQN